MAPPDDPGTTPPAPPAPSSQSASSLGDSEVSDIDLGPESEHRRIIAIGGGKGGVGKSLLAANLGIYLAQLGRRTVLVDADLGGANLHTFVGVERPKVTLGDLFHRRVARVEDCIVETAIARLGLLSGEGDPLWVADPRPATKRRLLDGVRALNADFIICDLPTGSGSIALDFFLAAQVGILVVVPEPTSAENAYRFLKSAFLRRLRLSKALGKEAGAVLERLTALCEPGSEGGIPSPLDIYQVAKGEWPGARGDGARPGDPALVQIIEEELQRFRPRLVVNQTRTRSDLELGPQMRSAGRRRLGLQVEYLGHLESDDAVIHAVRKRRPLLVDHPDSKIGKNIERIARKLLVEGERPRATPPRPTEAQTLYEVLEVDPGASDEEIRRAARRQREIYAQDSLVTCGLYGEERLAVMHRRLEQAYDTLLDGDRKRKYDLKLFPDGVPAEVRRRPAGDSGDLKPGTDPKLQSSELPLLTPETEVTGPLLQKVREARQLELGEIATRTKIGIAQLRAIEAEQWDALPATVYLRGFLTEYAKCLRLPAPQVVKSYLQRLEREQKEA